MHDIEVSNLIDSFWRGYSRATLTGQKAKLEKFYGLQSVLTIDVCRFSRDELVTYLLTQGREFQADTYSFMQPDDSHIIVTGICLWGNRRRSFTAVLWVRPPGEDEPKAVIVNHIII
jgi:hypothetical protein